jgi:hypothetical protein
MDMLKSRLLNVSALVLLFTSEAVHKKEVDLVEEERWRDVSFGFT